jgi:hypothetical protein
MEKFLANTKRQPCTVNVHLDTGGATVPIYIVGYDTINPFTLYFRSRFQISGEDTVNLNCPQSPLRLGILVWSEGDVPFDLISVDVTPLDAQKSDDPAVQFIEKFSRRAGIMRPGTYIADNVPFKIQYIRNIYTDDGEVHPTPARIHEDLPLIQVSRTKFREDTVPERIIILLHEMAHNFINSDQDNEKEADQNALNIYTQLGYPKIEAVNAFGDIMSDTDDNYQRMLNLVNMP